MPATSRAAPCFPGRRTVTIDSELWDFAAWIDDGRPAGRKGTWGTCKVDKGRVRAPDGTVVADVSCGASIRVAGIVDEHGGLWDAITKARVMAGIDLDEPIDLEYVGTLGPLSKFQRLLAGVFGLTDAAGGAASDLGSDLGSGPAAKLPPELAELMEVYAALASEGPLALMPFTLSVE